MQARNFVLALSLAATAYLSYSLYHEKSLTVKVKEEVRKQFPTIAIDGFVNGCMMAAIQLRGVEKTDPDYDMYVQWCTKNAKTFAESKKR